MTNYIVEVLDDAVFEIRDIYEYIRQDNEAAAKNIYQKIRESISNLAHFPYKGSTIDKNDTIMSNWKFIMVKPYLIFYKINGKKITVYHVLDGHRDYIKLLKTTQ